MTGTHERRRNAYADYCYICRKEVPAGDGWLYADTRSQRSRSRRRAHGTWSKQVKCNRCHEANISNKRQADNLDNPQPAEPVVRSWSVSQVKKWTVERGEQDGDVAVFVVGSGIRECVSHRDPINSSFCGMSEWKLEDRGIAGKSLSKSAVAELAPRIREQIVAVQQQEKANAIAAAEKLVAAGATVAVHGAWHCYKVTLKGGNYWMFGTMTGSTISGIPGEGQQWIETTVEELIASSGSC